MKKCFYTEKGPKAIGPYATACTAGNTVYFSGMLGVNPETGALAGDVASQARQSLDNLSAVAGEMGLSLDMTVKTTVFLTNLNDLPSSMAFIRNISARTIPRAPACRWRRCPRARRSR